jgi:nucleoside-diphosphate-sugar epimerase
VVSTLGVTFTREPVDTYSVGTGNIVAGMRAAGTRRLVVVSSTAAYPTRRSRVPLMLRFVEPILTNTIGKTVYDDIRRMETIVRDSGLDWTVVRPSGLFDLPEPTDYLSGEVDPVGAFTARVDLADYLVSLAADSTKARRTVIVSTTESTPSLWQMIRREAGSGDGAGAGDGNRLVTGTADLISCGAMFLANPDLPRRLARGGAEGGYTDYPVVAENDIA